MITYDIPGFGKLALNHLVLDYNGTIAFDGRPLNGVKKGLQTLSAELEIHVLTADTFGEVRNMLADAPCKVWVLPPGRQDEGKLAYVERLGPEHTVAIGNGRNDGLMLAAAALGIAVVLGEGAAMQTVLAADVCCTSIVSALELLLNPLRLVATLRS